MIFDLNARDKSWGEREKKKRPQFERKEKKDTEKEAFLLRREIVKLEQKY